jgi:hypothetical protein
MAESHETITPEMFEVKTLIPYPENTELRYYECDQEGMYDLLARLKSDDVDERIVDVSPLDE